MAVVPPLAELFADLPTVQTRRLLLRKLRMDDAADIFEYGRDPEVTRHLMWDPHRTIDDSREFLHWVLELYRRGEVAPWGIELRTEGRVVGTIGYHYWNRQHARAELGYSLARPYWGQGLMTEAARAAVDFGFRVMGLNRVEARCVPENTASARVMVKCGMRYEGTLREMDFRKGTFDDMLIYSILRREWATTYTGSE